MSSESGAVALCVGASTLTLLPDRAAWLDGPRALLVADVHLGKAASFRALGVPVPEATTDATLARLGALVKRHAPELLVVLGDLLHGPAAQSPVVIDALSRWRHAHSEMRVVLVRGNHDDRAGDPPPECGVDVVDAPWALGGFALCHEPPAQDSGAHALAGHLHPVVMLGGRADRLRLPCFHMSAHCTVLPAFGEFTGGWPISPGDRDRVFITDGERVREIPRPRAQVGSGRSSGAGRAQENRRD